MNIKNPHRHIKYLANRSLLNVPLYELVLCNSQLYFYSMHKLRNYGLLRDNLKDNNCTCLLSRLKITWYCMRPSTRQRQCTFS